LKSAGRFKRPALIVSVGRVIETKIMLCWLAGHR
jgi:hypothetical protein